MRPGIAFKNILLFRRWLESGHVAEGLLERRAVVVERAPRHRDADGADEAMAVVEDRGGQTAEVRVELLAVRGDREKNCETVRHR